MKTKYLLPTAIIFILALAACQPAMPPERPLNTGDRPRVGEEKPPVEEVLPTLAVETGKTDIAAPGKHEMKLRSQTSRYRDGNSSQIEIALTSSDLAYCQNESPTLGAGEESLTITIKSKDGKTALSPQEYAGNDAYELSVVYRNEHDSIELPASYLSSLKLTDLNNAIARGHLKIVSPAISIDGEFFTAICK